jgi:hypothetical protein
LRGNKNNKNLKLLFLDLTKESPKKPEEEKNPL